MPKRKPIFCVVAIPLQAAWLDDDPEINYNPITDLVRIKVNSDWKPLPKVTKVLKLSLAPYTPSLT